MATASAGSHDGRDARTWYAIFRIATAISSSLDLKQIIEIVCRVAVEICAADHAAVVLANNEYSQGIVKGEYGNGLKLVGQVVQLTNSSAEGDLFQKGTPILADDVALTTGLGPVRDLLLGQNIRSFIALPIRARGRVVGSLGIDVLGKRKAFLPQDIATCQEIASALGIAVERERLMEEVQAQQAQAERMQQAVAEINACQNTEELLKAMVTHAMKLLQARDAGVYLYLSQKRVLCLRQVAKSPEKRMNQMLKPGEGMAGRLFQTEEEFMMTPDYREWRGRSTGYDGAPFEAVLEVPIQDGAKTIGVLFVESAAGRNYTGEEAKRLRWLADEGAIVLHHTELERRLHVLLNATRLLAEQQDIDAGLKELAKTIVTSLEASFCRILLLNDTGATLVPKAHIDIERTHPAEPAKKEPLPIAGWPDLQCFLDSGEPHLLSYSNEQARPVLEAISARIGLSHTVQSLLLVPLKLGERVVGMIEVGEMRKESRQPITDERSYLVSAVANHVAVIAGRERVARLKNDFARFSEQLDEEKEQLPLFQDTLRFARLLFPGTSGAMFLRNIAHDTPSEDDTLEAIYVAGLPSSKAEFKVTGRDPVIGAAMNRAELVCVAPPTDWKTGQELFGENFQGTVAALPLQITGQVQAVMVLNDPSRQWLRPDLEPEVFNILERLGRRASKALTTSRLIANPPNLADQLMRLHPVIDYMLKATDLKKVLHIFLTGVTAGYALGFNRAAVFLVDAKGEYLEGRMAIGDSDLWDQGKLQINDFVTFTKALEAGSLGVSAFDDQVCRLRISLSRGDALTRAFKSRKWIKLEASDFGNLDPEFVRAFDLQKELLVGPLVGGSQAIGVLVVDNKFTEEQIDPEQTVLFGYAHRAAVTIQHQFALDEVIFARERLRRLHEEQTRALQVLFDATHRQPADEQGYLQLLVDVVTAASNQFSAPIVTLWPFDPGSQGFVPQELVGYGLSPELLEEFRKREPGQNHVTRTCLEQGYLKVEDVATERAPFLSETTKILVKKAGIASFQAVRLMADNEPLAVLYASYDRARAFTEGDEKALKTFAVGVSQTLHNARMHLEVLKARQAAQALSQMVKEFDSGEPLKIFEFIGQKAPDLLRCDIVTLFTYDQVMDRFSGPYVLRADHRQSGLRKADTFPNREWLHELLDKGGIEVVERVDQHGIFASTHFAQAEKIKSLMVVPLHAADSKVGLMFINHRQHHHFMEYERENAALVANLVSVAIWKAQFIAESKSLEEFAEKLQDCWSANEIARAASEQAQKMLGVDFAGVALEAEDGKYAPFGWAGWDASIRNLHFEKGRGSHIGFIIESHATVVVLDFKTEKRFVVSRILRRNGVLSGIGTSLDYDGTPRGALLAHSKRYRRYDKHAQRVLVRIANQTTTALQARRLQEAGAERLKEQAHAIEGALKAINHGSAGLNAEKIFVRILEQAVQLTEQRAHIATMHRFDSQNSELVLEAIYPDPKEGYQSTLVGKKWSTKEGYGNAKKIGVTGRAVQDRKPQVVPNVLNDPDYINISGLGDICSELVVPLRDGEEVLGVINLESKGVNAFSFEHRNVVEALAQMIVVVMRKVRDSEIMQKTMTQLNARTSLAWIGIITNRLGHDWLNAAGTIRKHLELAKQDLEKHFNGSIPDDLVKRLDQIDASVIDETSPLTSEDRLMPIRINALLREHDFQLGEHSNCRSVKLELHLDTEEDSTLVRANQEWLTYALDLIVHNAVREMQHPDVPTARRVLKLFTRPARKGVEIVFRDYGRGIPPGIREKLFNQGIEKRAGDPGMGIGTLMARIIVETYGGEIRLGEPVDDGTEVIMWFPRT